MVRQNMLTQPWTESYDLCHSSNICVHVINRVLRVQETRNCQSGSFHDRAQYTFHNRLCYWWSQGSGNELKLAPFSMSSPSEPDPTENSAFKKWLRKGGLVTGLAGTKEEQMAGLEEYKHTTCEKWKKELMTYSQYLYVLNAGRRR